MAPRLIRDTLPRARSRWLVAASAALMGALGQADSIASSPDTVRAPTNARVEIPADARLAIHLPKAEAVSFKGQIDQDKAGTGPGTMLYPAPGLAGFLVAVALHGALQSSALSAQQRKMQDDADKVLLPYRPLLDGFRHRELFGSALGAWEGGKRAQLLDSDNVTELAWRMRVDPTFTMTQDQTALILYATIAVTPPENPTSLAYTNVISVVLRPIEGDNPQAQWNANEGRSMRDAAGRMLAEALAVAMADMTEPVTVADSAFRTLRYREGGSMRIERAAVLSQGCERWVIRNLRGWIKSVPVTTPTVKPAACQDALRIEPLSAATASTPTPAPATPEAPSAEPAASDPSVGVPAVK